MEIEFQKRKFLEKNIEYLVFMSSLIGGFVYPFYNPRTTNEERELFKKYLSQELCILAQNYKHKDNIEEHADNIEILQKDLNTNWQKVLYPHKLKDGQVGVTFGRVQKLVNLYLKYYWVLGCVAEPPHCPVDSIILGIINEPNPAWQNPLFTKKIYINRIEKCKEKANESNISIAEWELSVFNKNQSKDSNSGNKKG